MQAALSGLTPSEVSALLTNLATVKENLRQAILRKQDGSEQRYG